MRMSSSIAEFRQQQVYYEPLLCARDLSPQHAQLFFARIKQLAAIIIALGFGFGLWFGVSNYTAPGPSYPYPAGMTYIGNGIYQLPDGTYTGDTPQGTNILEQRSLSEGISVWFFWRDNESPDVLL